MVHVCVCVCVYTLLSIYISKMSSRDYENLTTNFDCIYCQNFSMKTKLILGFLFILMTLVGLYNTHVLNYTRNIFLKKLLIKHQKTFSSSFSWSLITHQKMKYFSTKSSLENESFSRKTLMLKQTERYLR